MFDVIYGQQKKAIQWIDCVFPDCKQEFKPNIDFQTLQLNLKIQRMYDQLS